MKSTANNLRRVIGYINSLPASNCLLPPILNGTVAHIRYINPKIEKKMNSVEAAGRKIARGRTLQCTAEPFRLAERVSDESQIKANMRAKVKRQQHSENRRHSVDDRF